MSEEKKVILCVLMAVGIVIIMLGIVFSKIRDIEQRLDKCCPVKTEEVKVELDTSDRMRDEVRTAFVSEWSNRYQTQEL